MKEDRASSTARLIAAARVLAAREKKLHHLVDVETAELSERLLLAARGDWLMIAARSWFGRRLLLGFEHVMLRGLVWHWLVRKRAIEGLVKEAKEAGFAQLVVLGAGLDTLPLRMGDQFENVVCVDHPATQEVVRRAMPELDGPGSRVRLVAMDLAKEDLGPRLEPILAEKPTVVLAEGVLMYLERGRVAAVLRAAAGLRVPRLRVIVTAMDAAEGEAISFRPRSKRADGWLAKRSEPMKSSIPAGKEAEFFAAAGLRHLRTITAKEMRGERPGLDGENVIVGER